MHSHGSIVVPPYTTGRNYSKHIIDRKKENIIFPFVVEVKEKSNDLLPS